MKKLLLYIVTLTAVYFNILQAQNLQSPAEFLNYELGSPFTRHYKVVEYFTYISKNSKNVKL